MILRVHRKSGGYVQIPNTTLRDSRLSWKARGLLAYMLTHTTDWSFSGERLTREGPDGKTAVLSAMTELESAGYLRRTKHRNKRGHVTTIVDVAESPDLFGEMPVQQTMEYPPSVAAPSDNQLPLEDHEENTITENTIVSLADATVLCDVVGCPREAGHGGAHQNPWWDTLAEVFGYQPDADESKLWGLIIKKASDHDPSEIRRRCALYLVVFEDAPLTPPALNKWWNWLGGRMATVSKGEREAFSTHLAQLERRGRVEALRSEN